MTAATVTSSKSSICSINPTMAPQIAASSLHKVQLQHARSKARSKQSHSDSIDTKRCLCDQAQRYSEILVRWRRIGTRILKSKQMNWHQLEFEISMHQALIRGHEKSCLKFCNQKKAKLGFDTTQKNLQTYLEPEKSEIGIRHIRKTCIDPKKIQK